MQVFFFETLSMSHYFQSSLQTEMLMLEFSRAVQNLQKQVTITLLSKLNYVNSANC